MPLTRQIWGLGILLGGVLVASWFFRDDSVREEIALSTDAGQQYAERNCAKCHAVGVTGESPVAAAPPFRTFARLWPLGSIEEALAEGITMDHPSMPEFQLTPRQINDFIAYLETIQR